MFGEVEGLEFSGKGSQEELRGSPVYGDAL
jgi:hypothetical protein